MNWNSYGRLPAPADSDRSICIEKDSGEMPTGALLAATRRAGAVCLLSDVPKVLR
jgi:hypothetical protein